MITVDGEVEHPFRTADGDTAVRRLLERAAPSEGADHATVWSADGEFRMSIPLTHLRRAALVGGRLIVPDAPSRQWHVKDVVRIELTAGSQPDSFDAMNC